MADITFKLIWYRLGVSYKNFSEKYERFLDWYEDFSWRRVDILDMLFLGWIIGAFLVVGLLNLYLRFFGLPKYRSNALTPGDGKSLLGGLGLAGAAESCQWVNSAISWLLGHYHQRPFFVDCWLKALTEQTQKQRVNILINKNKNKII
jgi:hypothetical protein